MHTRIKIGALCLAMTLCSPACVIANEPENHPYNEFPIYSPYEDGDCSCIACAATFLAVTSLTSTLAFLGWLIHQ